MAGRQRQASFLSASRARWSADGWDTPVVAADWGGETRRQGQDGHSADHSGAEGSLAVAHFDRDLGEMAGRRGRIAPSPSRSCRMLDGLTDMLPTDHASRHDTPSELPKMWHSGGTPRQDEGASLSELRGDCHAHGP